MKLFCPDCDSLIPAADMDLPTGRAKCRHCDTLIDFADASSAHPAAARRPAEVSPDDMPRPPKVRVDEVPGGRVLWWRWYEPDVWFWVLFSGFWNGVTWILFVGFLAAALGWEGIETDGDGEPPSLWVLPFFSLHIAVGVATAYLTLTKFLNRTAVTLRPDELRVRHGPLPWLGNRRIDPADLDAVFIKVSKVEKNDKHPHYVSARRAVGGEVTLLRGLDSAEEARWFLRQIEAHCDIPARPVPGGAR